MVDFSYRIKSIGNACIVRFDRGEGPDLITIMNQSYPSLPETDRQQVRQYVATIRPDISYDVRMV
jgi:hypothetical protein